MNEPRKDMEVPARHVLKTTYLGFGYLLNTVAMSTWIHCKTEAGSLGPIFTYWRNLETGNGDIEWMIVATGGDKYSVTFK